MSGFGKPSGKKSIFGEPSSGFGFEQNSQRPSDSASGKKKPSSGFGFDQNSQQLSSIFDQPSNNFAYQQKQSRDFGYQDSSHVLNSKDSSHSVFGSHSSSHPFGSQPSSEFVPQHSSGFGFSSSFGFDSDRRVEDSREGKVISNGRTIRTVDSEHENSITIYIGAHGEEFFGRAFSGNVDLLSFSGYPGSLGRFFSNSTEYCHDVTIRDFEYNYRTRPHESQSEIFSSMPEILRQSFRDSFPGSVDKYFRDGGFKITRPKSERVFSLKPNHGENERFQNSYGIHIVDSSNPLDKPFTLKTTDSERCKLQNSYSHWMGRIGTIASPQKRSESLDILNMIVNFKQTSLSDLVKLFNNLGYLKIYIYDPSCRQMTSKLGDSRENQAQIYQDEGKMSAKQHLQRGVYAVMEQTAEPETKDFADAVLQTLPSKTKSRYPQRPPSLSTLFKLYERVLVNGRLGMITSINGKKSFDIAYDDDAVPDYERDINLDTHNVQFFKGGRKTKNRKTKNRKTKNRKTKNRKID